ncbi:dihydroxyacetone kinase subunit DhaL [Kitasatospora sp. NPDC048365]|uniref:dihydroxyacetone kinase subunit DhaL n=1 Tax=Kitasatospora sp. NPDC048365 TaxID=3364050 RepID=UPI00371A1A1E
MDADPGADPAATPETVLDAALATAWLRAAAEAVEAHREELTALDTAIGDGDHGANLSRGFTAVTAALGPAAAPGVAPDSFPGTVLKAAGTTLLSTVGGASGPLYGSALRAIGAALPGPVAGAGQVADALAAGLAAVQALGGAVPGDKTIVDAYAPAVDAFRAAVGRGLPAACRAAAEAAERGAADTAPLQARKGRASYLGPRSVGHRDPGATSTALLLRALADCAAVSGRSG